MFHQELLKLDHWMTHLAVKTSFVVQTGTGIHFKWICDQFESFWFHKSYRICLGWWKNNSMFKWDTTHYLTQLATPNGFFSGHAQWEDRRLGGLAHGWFGYRVRPAVSDLCDYTDQQTSRCRNRASNTVIWKIQNQSLFGGIPRKKRALTKCKNHRVGGQCLLCLLFSAPGRFHLEHY